MAERFNPNYKRDRLAEQILCSLVAGVSGSDKEFLRSDYMTTALVGRSLEIARAFLEATKPAVEESASVEVDEFDESLIIDSDGGDL